MEPITIEPVTAENRRRVTEFLRVRWFSTEMAVRGRIFSLADLEGYAAFRGCDPVGAITYFAENGACEIVSLDSAEERAGIGTALLNRVLERSGELGCARVRLITTNDNLNALRFYQKRGFDLTRLYRNALEASRKLKPEIPLIGEDGIPLRHELELEYEITNSAQTEKKE